HRAVTVVGLPERSRGLGVLVCRAARSGVIMCVLAVGAHPSRLAGTRGECADEGRGVRRISVGQHNGTVRNVTPRRPSPLAGRKPTKDDLARVDTPAPDGVDDVLPHSPDVRLRLLIVGVNPGLWTAAVNAPFARPGNRFWPSLHRAGL